VVEFSPAHVGRAAQIEERLEARNAEREFY
jgi:hypothetical protein